MALALAGSVGLAFVGCKPAVLEPAVIPNASVTNLYGTEDQSIVRDWPQWRHDANHTANSPADLSTNLYLQWTRQYSQRVQVWDDPLNHDLMPYDKVFEPVVLGERMFIGFNDRDKVVALDIRTGRQLWEFFTDGPVRLPPAAWEGKVYFVSDDGHLYCVRAEDGALVWKFRGGPSARKALGNGRVISAWPARGGVALRDGQVYFTASIWPFMGTFIYALDAATGRVVWVNDGTGAQYIKQPHSAPAFAGVAPQGPLVATRDILLVPGGRSVPAGFDRRTGLFLFYQLEDNGKGNGGSFVAASEKEFFVHTRERGTRNFDLKTGRKGGSTISEPVITTNHFYSAQPCSFLQAAVLEAEQKLVVARLAEYDAQMDVARSEDEGSKSGYKNNTNALASATRKVVKAEAEVAKKLEQLGTNHVGCVIQEAGSDKKPRWELPVDGTGDIIKVGNRLYAAGTNIILGLNLRSDKKPRLVWSNAVDGRVLRLLAANGMLFAVTLDGRIMAFGDETNTPETLTDTRATNAPPPEALARAKAIVEQAGARQGYALCFGVEDGALIEALARESELHITAVDTNAAKIEELRRRFDAAGLYGTRVALQVGDPLSFKAPPYIANLVVMGESFAPRLADRAVLAAVYESVRPYGGTLWVTAGQGSTNGLADKIRGAALVNAKVSAGPDRIAVVREGALAGAAEWTHQYGNVANTMKSDDALVKLPLGVLWFGGPSHMDVLPRHGHGPSAQVVNGRLFVEGMNCLSARDVYTGRTLWKTDFEDLGTYGIYYDWTYTNVPLTTIYNQKHIPGANARGANFVATADAIYVAVSNTCRVLDPRDGRTRRIIELPAHAGEAEVRQWGYLGVLGDVLLAGDGFADYTDRLSVWTSNSFSTNRPAAVIDQAASRGLMAFDRHTGEKLWSVEAVHGFMHNGIVAGQGRVYCLDRLPKTIEDRFRRRNRALPSHPYRISVFDARTGGQVWEAKTDVFGTWLAYSGEHDVLLQAGAVAVDRLKDEAEQGLFAYRGASGDVLWKKSDLKYTGPLILRHDTILTTPTGYKTNSGCYNLLDGKPRFVTNPLTGESEPWRIYRTYGCGSPIACENLMTFRSGAAGFYDLEHLGGSGNFGGFKSSCSANLIAADGVLNAPEYTRTCSCPYQNQTSLAFVHVPDLESEVEIWTHTQFGAGATNGVRMKRLGINFGAPGDRLSETGTLWLDFPNVGGTSPNLAVAVKGSQTNYFRHHASLLQGAGPSWVMASGVRNAETILIAPETRKAGPPPAAPKRKSEDDDDDYDDHLNGTNDVAGAKSGSTKTNKTEKAYKSVLSAAAYTVRLYFAEPDDLKPGERVFNVALETKPVLKNFDIVAEAGGVRRGVVKEFCNVVVKGALEITLTRAKGKQHGPVLCGVEMLLE